MRGVTRRSVLGFLGGAALAELAPGTMCRVPAGKFTMGERETVHEVYLDDFHIGKYPVTNAEYRKFTDATGQRMLPRHWKATGTFPEGKADHPVLWVSWNDAMKYCEWLSSQTNAKVTLPTEAQWEKAARGTEAFVFPWGNDRNQNNLNFNGLCARHYGLEVTADGRVPGWRDFTETAEYRRLVDDGGYTTAVGSFPSGKSPYGCYDMAGNAYEWCLDWYTSDYFRLPSADTNPAGPDVDHAENVNRAAEHGKVKVIRGGSWYGHLMSGRTTNREETRRPEGGYHTVGFRIVSG